MTLTLMCGLPRSGKTTYSTELAERNGALCIHSDEEIGRLIHTLPDHSLESLNALEDSILDLVAEAIANGNDVIYDSCNHTVERRAEVVERCHVDALRVVCIYMATPDEVCFERDKIGWSRILAEKIEVPTEAEGFDELIICNDGYTDADLEPKPDLNTLQTQMSDIENAMNFLLSGEVE